MLLNFIHVMLEAATQQHIQEQHLLSNPHLIDFFLLSQLKRFDLFDTAIIYRITTHSTPLRPSLPPQLQRPWEQSINRVPVNMAELGPFISTSDHHLAASQICSMLRGNYDYRAIRCTQPFCTDSDLLFEDHCITRPVKGTTTIEPLFPTAFYTQLLITSTIHLYRRIEDGPEEYVKHTERLLLRVNDDSHFSVWALLPPYIRIPEQGPDSHLRYLGKCDLKRSPINGHGGSAHQRVMLLLNRPRYQYRQIDDWFPWDVFQITLYIGPGIENAIAGKKPGFEIAWAELKATQYPFNIVEHTYAEARTERYEPMDKETKVKWMGNGNTNWDLIAPKPLSPPRTVFETDLRTDTTMDNSLDGQGDVEEVTVAT